MRIGQIKKMAKSLGLKIIPTMKKSEIIKTIQKKENNFDCFGTAIKYCDQENCLFRKDCFEVVK
jgi:hypothetical protein